MSGRAHLVGVGGAGMSALARLLHARGAVVSGSDDVDTPVVGALRDLGVEVWVGVRPDRIGGGREGQVVRSAAVAAGHPEVLACVERGWESRLYAEALGRLSAEAETIAIAGTHGKTSTTALTAAALRGGGIDASHVVGGDVPDLGGSGHAGRSPWLVVEACEYARSFHQLSPRAAALLNFDQDHFDCYPTRAELLEAYARFAARVRPGGLVVAPADAPGPVLSAVRGACRVARLGTDGPADLRALDVDHHLGRFSFVPSVFGRRLPRVQLAVPGGFQVHNALAALALALEAGADEEGACRGLSCFAGVHRRFELRVGRRGGEVVNDYAHHPAEIDAVITTAVQRFPGRRLIAVFQPHQHRRTRALLGEFAAALARAHTCLIADIYGARESAEVRAGVSAADLVAAVRERGGQCEAAGGLQDLPDHVLARYREGDVILMLGAGDIDRVVGDVLAGV